MPDSIRSVGAAASLHHDGSDDPDWALVDLCLFATVEGGERVSDPRPPSASVRVERSKLAAVELSVQMSLRLRQAPTGPRLEAWQRIAAELAERGIAAEPEELHRMRFEFVPDDELRTEQQKVWPHGH